jgi:hypothetical protein
MSEGGGENNSPPPVLLLGQAGPGPALPSALGLAQKSISDFVGPRSAQSILGRENQKKILKKSFQKYAIFCNFITVF